MPYEEINQPLRSEIRAMGSEQLLEELLKAAGLDERRVYAMFIEPSEQRLDRIVMELRRRLPRLADPS